MDKRRVEELTPKAIELIKDPTINLLKKDKNENEYKIAKECKGYISSFGASIIQSGMIPTIAFFENEEGQAKSERKELMKVILYMIEENYKIEEKKKETTLLDYILEKKKNDEDLIEIEEEIINAAIALKLALRTFKFSE